MPSTVPELVLDAWPVLEWIKGREPTRSTFRRIVEDALAGRVKLNMSRINQGEVLYSVQKRFPPDRVVSALSAFGEIPITFHSVDDRLIDDAVQLKSVYAISYADAFAVALSVRLRAPLVSGDPELKNVAVSGFQLEWVGK